MANVDFEPKILSDYFNQITRYSHPSGKEDAIRTWVINSVKSIIGKYPDDNRKNISIIEYNPDAIQDNTTNPGLRNIFLRRDGSSQLSGMTPVILQAHMDMVTVPSADIFPLNLSEYTDGTNKWLRADNTTLGADDGIGVATILSVLEDEDLKDIPLECLFTVQEETDMGGAENFDVTLLRGKKYINLDAEDLNVIIYGSAGGCSTTYKSKISYNTEDLKNYQTFTITVENLKSGHSGIDINKCRLNAVKAVAEVLARLDKRLNNISPEGSINSYDLIIHDILRTETEPKPNAIPANCMAVVSVPLECSLDFYSDANILLNLMKQRSQPVESTFECSVKRSTAGNLKPMSKAFTDSLLNLLNQLPDGVVKMIEDNPDIVETSTNLFNVAITGDEITVYSSNRSSSDSSLDFLNNIQINIGNCHGFTVDTNKDRYPAWQPNSDSQLLKDIAFPAYQRKYQDKAEKTVIHAGLECSWIVSKSNDIDCISIGPTIQNPHTKTERLLLEYDGKQAVVAYYEVLKEILANIFK